MKKNAVEIRWNEWIAWDDDDNEDWDMCRVIYMYGNDLEPLYIGRAYKENVRQRYSGNEDRNVIKWIEKNTSGGFWIKVGHIWLTEDQNITLKKVEDIHTLIIYLEYNQRGFCRANIANTKTRPNYRPDMVVKNTGHYHPLASSYHDIPSDFFE